MGEPILRRIDVRLVLAVTGLLPGIVLAEPVFFATPSLSASAIYDDNLFSSPTDPQHDRILRASPAIEAGSRSAPMTLSARYTFDAEKYARHPELDDNRVREHAALDYLYHPSRALTFAANTGYAKTQMPGELNLETGLEFARARAERFSFNPALAYQFDRRTVGTTSYSYTRDKVAGGIGSDTHLLGLGLDRRITRRDTVSAGYQFRKFQFDEEDTTTHTLIAGGTRQFTPQTAVTLMGGPRYSDGSIDPEVSALLRHALKRGELSLAYTRTETTVIGQVGTATTESLGATVTYLFGPSLELRAAPSLFSSKRGNLQADVYRMNLDVGYRMTRYLSIVGSYLYSSQRGRIDVPGDEEITRNVFSLGMVIAPPTRTDAAPRTRARFPSALDREWRLKQTEMDSEQEQ